MNKKEQIIILLIILLSQVSCKIGEWDVTELYGQKIEGTSKILYKYDAWGGRDSNANGFIVLDSTSKFKVDLQNDLPFYCISEIPNKKNIEGVTHECYNSCDEQYYKTQPIFAVQKTNKSESNGINILTRIFQYRGFSEKERGLERYVFEKFVETKDSLFFYNLNDIESVDGIHLEELKIKKGEIYLQQNEKKEIKKIIAKEVKLNLKSKAIERLRIVYLTPKNKVINTEFSERGIFRELKIVK